MISFFQKFRIDRQTGVFFLILGLLAVFGAWLLAYSTPDGLGINDDAVAYIAGARGLLNGQGYRELWLITNQPIVHFPPGFPGTLALIGLLTGLDPVRGARLLNGSLFGLSALLSGLIVWRTTKSKVAAVLMMILFLASDSLLEIHSNAMSEPLYVFLTLLAFLLLILYFERQQRPIWLIGVIGLLVGIAYLTRYAALSLLATLLVALVLLHTTWRKRILSAAVLFVSAFPLIAAWSIRNRVVGGSITNRNLGWHPVTEVAARMAYRTFSAFLMPINAWQTELWRTPHLTEWITDALILVLLAWVVYTGLRQFFRPVEQPVTGAFINGLYVFGYLSALITTMTLFDPATKFQIRLLAPMYPSLLILLVAFGVWLWDRKHILAKILVPVLAICVFGVSFYGQYEKIQNLRLGGQVFANTKWRSSELMATLRDLPSETVIVTDQPYLVYLYTDRRCSVLPEAEPGISQLRQQVLDGEAVLVLFKVANPDPGTGEYRADLSRGLYPLEFNSDMLYIAPPQ